MAKAQVTTTINHSEMIEALDKILDSPDFNPRSWSVHEADRLFSIAKRIKAQVFSYYHEKYKIERSTGE